MHINKIRLSKVTKVCLILFAISLIFPPVVIPIVELVSSPISPPLVNFISTSIFSLAFNTTLASPVLALLTLLFLTNDIKKLLISTSYKFMGVVLANIVIFGAMILYVYFTELSYAYAWGIIVIIKVYWVSVTLSLVADTILLLVRKPHHKS